MKTHAMKLKEMFRRWSKPEWLVPIDGQVPLAGERVRRAEHSAATQEWEHEGGALKPAPYRGPKSPL
jgi:hypothetical protein